MGCVVALIIFLLIYWAFASPSTFFIGLFIAIGLGIWGGISSKKTNREKMEKAIKVEEENVKMYKEKKIQFNIDETHLTVYYKSGFASIARAKQYIWIEEDKLCFFPATIQSDEYRCTVNKISLKDIEYYATQGNISKETKISGGGGDIGGSSIGGAVIGGVLAGGVGAVIGSRKKGKIEPIKSEIITHDDRETFMNYFIHGIKHSMFFNYGDYTTFLKIMPYKDYNNVVNAQLSSGSKLSVKEQLIELADLKEKGILTVEEFDETKKRLLDKI